ncbi:MAG: class I SAM-dependent methyltransferase [Candidatus Bathyarchaeota archaeon]|nr:MAG: class I SAM-dependent methyltransferase [Candidatus Bathyarchaeota archaeon]
MNERLKIPERLGYLEGQTLVDVGCGDGRYLLHLCRKGRIKFFVGFDLSRENLLWARKSLRENGFNVSLLVADAECPPFADNAFEIVFNTDVIEHLAHPSEGIREAVRISSDKVIICTPNKLCPLDMSRFAQIFGSHKAPPMEKYVTRFQLKKMLQSSNLERKNIVIREASFLPLGWLLTTRGLPISMKLVNILMLFEELLEKTPLVRHAAGVLVACAEKK